MLCPYCLGKTKVSDTRDKIKSCEVRRRRECEDCYIKFTTLENLKPGSIKTPFNYNLKNNSRKLR